MLIVEIQVFLLQTTVIYTQFHASYEWTQAVQSSETHTNFFELIQNKIYLRTRN